MPKRSNFRGWSGGPLLFIVSGYKKVNEMMTGGDQCICGSEYLINNQDNDHVPEEVVKLQEWALTKTMSTTAAVIADNLQFNSMASPNLLNTTTVNDDDNPSDDQIATKLKLTLTEDEQVISQVAACKETTPEVIISSVINLDSRIIKNV